MSLFDKLKSKKEDKNKEPADQEAAESPPAVGPDGLLKEEVPAEGGEGKVVLPSGKDAFAYGVIVSPYITEKSNNMGHITQYVFRVSGSANKVKVKKAIEGLYNVSVEGIRIVNLPAKKRRLGRYEGFRSGFKKAIVKLKEGESIQLT